MMPGMDGLETTRLLRQLPNGRNVPIVALTANAVSGVKEMFIANGMNDFISKPIELSKLESILQKWIPRSKFNMVPIGEEDAPRLEHPDLPDQPDLTEHPEASAPNKPWPWSAPEEGFLPIRPDSLVESEAMPKPAPLLGQGAEEDRPSTAPHPFSLSLSQPGGLSQPGDSSLGPGSEEAEAPADTGPTNGRILDPEAVLSQLGGDRELMLEVMELFVKSTPGLLERMRSPQPGELSAYAETAHTIKGSSLNIGVDRIGTLAAGLEKAAKTGDYEAVLKGNDLFIKSAELLLSEMRSYLKEIQP
jgi:HPt (histidine-containing phosphotransfer) domain-containing protein